MAVAGARRMFEEAMRLRNSGRPKEAQSLCRRLLLEQPRHAQGHWLLGSLLQSQSLWEEAVTSFRKAISLDPDFANALNDLGNLLLARGRYEEAVEVYRKLLRFNYAEPYN